MNGQSPPKNIFVERAALVLEASGLNGEILRAYQAVGGAEIETMRLEIEIEAEGETAERRRMRDEALDHQNSARAVLEACERRMARLERRIDAIDRAIAET